MEQEQEMPIEATIPSGDTPRENKASPAVALKWRRKEGSADSAGTQHTSPRLLLHEMDTGSDEDDCFEIDGGSGRAALEAWLSDEPTEQKRSPVKQSRLAASSPAVDSLADHHADSLKRRTNIHASAENAPEALSGNNTATIPVPIPPKPLQQQQQQQQIQSPQQQRERQTEVPGSAASTCVKTLRVARSIALCAMCIISATVRFATGALSRCRGGTADPDSASKTACASSTCLGLLRRPKGSRLFAGCLLILFVAVAVLQDEYSVTANTVSSHGVSVPVAQLAATPATPRSVAPQTPDDGSGREITGLSSQDSTSNASSGTNLPLENAPPDPTDSVDVDIVPPPFTGNAPAGDLHNDVDSEPPGTTPAPALPDPPPPTIDGGTGALPKQTPHEIELERLRKELAHEREAHSLTKRQLEVDALRHAIEAEKERHNKTRAAAQELKRLRQAQVIDSGNSTSGSGLGNASSVGHKDAPTLDPAALSNDTRPSVVG